MGPEKRGADGSQVLSLQWATAGGNHLSVDQLKEVAETAVDYANGFGEDDNYLFVDTSQIKGKIRGNPKIITSRWAAQEIETPIFPQDMEEIETISATEREVHYLKKRAVLMCRRPLADSNEKVRDRGGVFIPWDEDKWSSVRKVTCESFSFNADTHQAMSADGLGMKVHLDLLFKVECTRSNGQAIVKLSIPHMDFGIETICDKSSHGNQSCGSKCGQHFTSEMTIEVRPIDWAVDSRELEPCHSSRTFTVQTGTTYDVHVYPPRQFSAGRQVTNSISYEDPADRWHPAYLDYSSKSVSWTWNLSRFADGSRFSGRRSFRILGSEPLLEHNTVHTPMMPPVSASWDVLPEDELLELALAWKINIIVKTCVLRSTAFCYNSLFVGPTIAFDGQLAFA